MATGYYFLYLLWFGVMNKIVFFLFLSFYLDFVGILEIRYFCMFFPRLVTKNATYFHENVVDWEKGLFMQKVSGKSFLG